MKRSISFIKYHFSEAEAILLVLIVAVAMGGILSLINPLKRGLRALYFTDSGWTDPPAFTAHEEHITLDRMTRVLPRHTTDYSIQWIGFIRIPEDGDYEFTLVSDDGSSLFLDQQVLIDNGGFHGKQERSGQRSLTKGFHAIQLNYMQGQDLAIFRAFWTPPGRSRWLLSDAVLTLNALSRKAYWAGRGIEILVWLLKFLIGVCLLAEAYLGFVRHRPVWLRLRVRFVCVAILGGVFIGHFWLSGITTSWDSKWSIHTALSIVREGNTDLDEYVPIT